MTEPRAELAHQLRISLLEVLAPTSQCALCFVRADLEDLEIDHIDGCRYYKRDLAAWTRAELYWREYDAGVRMRPLCKSCNSSDGQRLRGCPRWRRSVGRAQRPKVGHRVRRNTGGVSVARKAARMHRPSRSA